MLIEQKQQALLISGESGAGKTEAVKACLRYVVSRSSDAAKGHSSAAVGGDDVHARAQYIENCIMQANPLLEALGNAKTVHRLRCPLPSILAAVTPPRRCPTEPSSRGAEDVPHSRAFCLCSRTFAGVASPTCVHVRHGVPRRARALMPPFSSRALACPAGAQRQLVSIWQVDRGAI